MSEEHNLVKPANLIASDPEEANAIAAALGFEGDLEEAKGKADTDRAATLRQRLKQNARRAARTFDAVEFALSLGDVELADFVPTMGWHGDPATSRQKATLSKFGVDPGTITCKGQAGARTGRRVPALVLMGSWSSYPWYAARAGRPAWFGPQRVLGELGLEDTAAGRRRYAQRMRERAVAELTREKEPAELAELRRGWCLGGEGFRERMLRVLDGAAGKLRRPRTSPCGATTAWRERVGFCRTGCAAWAWKRNRWRGSGKAIRAKRRWRCGFGR